MTYTVVSPEHNLDNQSKKKKDINIHKYYNQQDVNRLGIQTLLWVLDWRDKVFCFAIIYTEYRWLDGDKQTYIMLSTNKYEDFIADAFSETM